VAEEEFSDRNLAGAVFEKVDLTGSTFTHVDLSGARFRDVYLRGARIRNAYLKDLEITGEIDHLTVNGVDVGPLIERELDRLHPERITLRPTDAAGFRAAWALVDELWAPTIARARELAPELLHESVDGEWSFIETLRHLAFATDAWIARGLLGDPAPWHPLDLPWDERPDTPGVPRDRDVRPSLDEALALRADRRAMVARVLEDLTDERLAGSTEPVEGPGWPPPTSFPVREVLSVVLEEEWAHRRYAERDLDVLTARS
jgi:DinB superfamily/Pentapeptide repeats (8 copies)